MNANPLDKQAVSILMDTMKSAQAGQMMGWFEWAHYRRYVSDADFEYAVGQGVMFPPERIGHDDIFLRIKRAVRCINKQQVVDAFKYSLSTRQLVYRSFLTSYCMAKSLQEHAFTPMDAPNETVCAVCGLHTWEFENPVEFNTTHYFKRLGGWDDHPLSVLFDVEHFAAFPKVSPSDADEEILRALKAMLQAAAPNDRVAQLKKATAKILKSNAEERQALLEMLGVLDILHNDEHGGYTNAYVPYAKRAHRTVHFDEVAYPARWWQGKDGVDEAQWVSWFGLGDTP